MEQVSPGLANCRAMMAHLQGFPVDSRAIGPNEMNTAKIRPAKTVHSTAAV